MLTWKIVGDPKASVLHIYIYIMHDCIAGMNEYARKWSKQQKLQLLFLMRAWREQQIHILLFYLSNKLKIWRICSWYIEDSFFIIVLFCFCFFFLFFFFSIACINIIIKFPLVLSILRTEIEKFDEWESLWSALCMTSG